MNILRYSSDIEEAQLRQAIVGNGSHRLCEKGFWPRTTATSPEG